MLIEQNRFLNLTSVDDPESIRARHFADSLAALDVLDSLASAGPPDRPLRVIDVGSGAGFPGLVLALARPDWRVVSADAKGKKIAFQSKVVEALSLSNVELVQARAEDLAHDPVHRETYDAALARALAPLAVLLELTLPFVRQGGKAIAWKGPKADEEMRGVEAALDALGGGAVEALPYSLGGGGEVDGVDRVDGVVDQEGGKEPASLRLIAISKTGPTPAAYPRKPRAIRKRPLA